MDGLPLKPTGPRQYLYIGQVRTFRLTATESTLREMAKALVQYDFRRLPGYFIAEMPEGRFIENGLEPPDALIFRTMDCLNPQNA